MRSGVSGVVITIETNMKRQEVARTNSLLFAVNNYTMTSLRPKI